MSIATTNLDLPGNFTGIVKVFPLPNLVLFPGVVQPLHVFEPRYRKMVRDALDSDQLIAIGTLVPGSKQDTKATPPIYPTLCIGKIVSHCELEDGRFNVLLCGVRRASLIRELPSSQPYRLADVSPYLPDQLELAADRRTEIRQAVLGLLERLVQVDQRLDKEAFSSFARDGLGIASLLDLVTFSCGANVVLQQKVLECRDVEARAAKVVALLQRRIRQMQADHQAKVSSYPPQFSLN